MNKLFVIVIAALVVLTTVGVAFASVDNITFDSAASIQSITVNGDVYNSGDTLQLNLGDKLDIRVKVQATHNVDNLEASTRLVGYEYAGTDGTQISDTSDLFDMQAGDTKYVDLQITIPVQADKDVYELRVDLDGRTASYGDNAFTIRIAGPRKAVLIRDIILTPSGSVDSGRSILGQARLENIGERDENDIKVTMGIPTLGVEGSVYMDSLNGQTTLGQGETKSSEEIYLRIPPCAKPGTYDLTTTVDFDVNQETTQTQQITITDGGLCTDNPSGSSSGSNPSQKVIVTAPSAQNVQIGVGGASFPVVIQNTGTASKTFVVSVNGVSDWGAYQISDPAPVVAGGETKVVYIYVTAQDGVSPGARVFGIDVTVDGQKQSITAQAILTQAATHASATAVLWWIFGVLIFIVVVLGLIVAIRNMKGKKDDEMDDDLDSSGQAYY